jgi:DNA-binding CsgD family transcriptional regulator
LKTLEKIKATEAIDMQDFCDQIQHLPYDPLLESYKGDLLDKKGPSDIMVFPNQFFYISDFHQVKNDYVHPNAEKILGFSNERFNQFGFIYEITHPEDRGFVLAFSMKTIVHSRKLKELLKHDRFCAVFSIDFRAQHADGSIIRLNRHTCCYRTDREGNMAYALSLFTDITHLKKPNCITYSWAGEGAQDFNIDDILSLNGNIEISHRELEVLKCLAEGMAGSEIANSLHISEHTVISHRKNMLRKLGARNTTELVNIAVKSGFL